MRPPYHSTHFPYTDQVSTNSTPHISYQNKPKLRPIYHSTHFPYTDQVSTNSTPHISYQNKPKLRPTYNSLHFSYTNMPKLRPLNTKPHISHITHTKIDTSEMKLCSIIEMGFINNKDNGWKVVVYKLSDLDNESLKISENRCDSSFCRATWAIWWWGMLMWSINNKYYGSKEVDYELSECDKEKHENASTSLCVH